MMTEERAADYRRRIAADLAGTLNEYGVDSDVDLRDAIIDDAMFHIEHLLVEIASLHREVLLLRERTP